MKVYFTASVAASNKYIDNYKKIIDVIVSGGHKPINDHIINKDFNEIKSEDDDQRRVFYKKVISWIKESSLVVSEVSFPSSINVGHEITLALEYDKPVLALYSKGNSPIFLEGNTSERFILAEYDPNDKKGLERIVSKNIKKLMKSTDIRFNFFIPPEISRYLDWIGKVKRIPKSVYLRDLIEEDMKNYPEYTK